MGRYVFKLPDVGEGTAQAELVAWHVAVGDSVAEDQPLADVMTDKATVELTSPVAGVVRELHGAPGDMRAVKSALVVLEVEGAGAASDPDDQRLVPTPAGERNTDARDTPPTTPAAERPEADPTGSPVETAPQKAGDASDVASQTGRTAQIAPPDPSGTPPFRAPSGGGTPPPSAPPADAFPQRRPSAEPTEGAAEVAPADAHQRAPGAAGFAPSQGLAPPAHATRVAGQRPLASPAVRRRAYELGVRLQQVAGSGPAGRVCHADLDAFLRPAAAAPAPASSAADLRYARREALDDLKVIGLRRRIAAQMAESKRRIPHFGYVEAIDVTELEDLRAHLNATRAVDQPKLTVLPFLVRALCRALPGYPSINARFDDEAGVLHRHAGVHLGVATMTPAGLIVPVVRHAETLDVWALAGEIARLARACREGTARKEELSGSTLTLTSLGTLGGVSHTPVINHPETAIVGPNKIVETPVVRGGQVVVRRMMNVSSSFDHRVVDGFDAAAFIQSVKGLLEHPATLFM